MRVAIFIVQYFGIFGWFVQGGIYTYIYIYIYIWFSFFFLFWIFLLFISPLHYFVIFLITDTRTPKTTKNTAFYFVWKYITFKKIHIYIYIYIYIYVYIYISARPIRHKLFQYFLLQVDVPQIPQKKKHNVIFCLELHNI